ncbi:GEVED domain-containing protein [Gaoshiqia sediminis]|uniref:GEVED domain-containing protein n=1 Tax=Gaoshiqia sediminis TaxID=2986998 RepID=A0AA42CBC9_9BACT|nr:GEVED domain-containing protein [Gaoshiqia sediminis]MCW0484835.1 GEVED domain-containing protein [Gaoshiqia sediminis]
MENDKDDEYYYADNIVVQGITSSFCNGSALFTVQPNPGVINPSDALGLPDGNAAELYDDNDQLVLDLTGGGQIRSAGTTLDITWRRDPGTGDTPQIRVETSSDLSSWNNIGTYNPNNTTYFVETITLTSDARYIRFTEQNAYNIDIDAVTYSCCSATPFTVTVTGDGSYCAGGSGVAVGLDGSETGVTYELHRDGVATGVTEAGTGSAISFPNQTLAGIYTVVGELDSDGCTVNMTGSATITIDDVPGTTSNPSPANGATSVCYAGDGAISSISWEPVPGATSYEVYFGAGSLPGSVTSNETSTTYSTGSLSANTTYYWKVVPKNDCGDAIGSSTWTFTTAGSACLNYCNSSGNMSYETSITLVSFNTINNSSDSGGKVSGYSNYTAQSTDLVINSTYDLSVNLNTDGVYVVYAKAWIDWNQDGNFSGAEETYDLGSAFYTTDGSTNNSPLEITVPSSAVLGATRMRIAAKWPSSPASACETNFDGETEDYTVNIIDPCTVLPSLPSTTGASICIGSSSTYTLNASGASSGDRYLWYDVETGGTPLKTSSDHNDNTFATPVLTTATDYWVSILNSSGCESTRTQVSVTFPSLSPDDPNLAGTDSWIGHVYKRLDAVAAPPSDADAFTNYYGHTTETELFDRDFGTSCFAVITDGETNEMYPEYFAVRYRMTSSREEGIYLVNIGSDDGTRLTVDGDKVYDRWVQRGYTTDSKILFELTGTSNLMLEFFESAGGNRVSFQSLEKVPNTISTTDLNYCVNEAASSISGNDAFTESPVNSDNNFTITYQWESSADGVSNWMPVSGATSRDFTPPTSTAGTTYYHRVLTIEKTNEGSIPVIAQDENSGVVKVTVSGELTITCPLDGGSVDCINNLPAAATTIDEFEDLGGTVTYSCPGSLTLSHEDVVSTSSGCQVTRTYTISNGAGIEETCTQNFTITDSEKPTFQAGELADVILGPEPEASCTGNTATIPQPDADDNCGFALEYASYSYRLGDKPSNPLIEGEGDINETFPEGTTTITWIVTDECGNESDPGEQRVIVEFPLTPITYDGGSTTPSEGSGAKPMLTSTHTYQVDGGTAESGYTYLWEIYSDFNHDGVIEGSDIPLGAGFTMSPNNSGAEVDITFTGLTPNEFYILSLIKTKTSTSCTKQELLPVIIRENTFDVALDDLADQCQTVGTGTTTYFWNITFPAVATEPFEFDYAITMDGAPIQSGTINNIRSTENWTLTPASGAAPLVQTEKSEPYKVVLYFTFNNIPGSEIAIGLSIQATDTYQVSDPNVTNNSDSLKAFEIPSISFD